MGCGVRWMVLCIWCVRSKVVGCSLLKMFSELRNGFLGLDFQDKDGILSFAKIGQDVCESVGFAFRRFGCRLCRTGVLPVDELGAICVDLSEVLVMGRKIMDAVDKNKEEALFGDCLKNELFMSPEVLLKLLQKKGAVYPESGNSRYSHPIGYGLDVWLLACVLLQLLVGDALPWCTLEMNEENGLDLSASYGCWMEKVSLFLDDKLGSVYIPLRQTFCKCLEVNLRNCPSVLDVKNCIQGMLVKHQLDFLGKLEITINRNRTDHCLILELCHLPNKSSKKQREHELLDREGNGQPSFVQDGEGKSTEEFGASPSKELIQFKDLQGHLDCITGLVVGGDICFAPHFDKTDNVWSLQGTLRNTII